jgi:hypothetical protein
MTGITQLDLRHNINLKTLILFWSDVDNLDLLLSNAPSIENLRIGRLFDFKTYSLDLSNNSNLRNLQIDDYLSLPEVINLRNGANHKLESISLSLWVTSPPVCIAADNPSYVQSIVQIAEESIESLQIGLSCSD